MGLEKKSMLLLFSEFLAFSGFDLEDYCLPYISTVLDKSILSQMLKLLAGFEKYFKK